MITAFIITMFVTGFVIGYTVVKKFKGAGFGDAGVFGEQDKSRL